MYSRQKGIRRAHIITKIAAFFASASVVITLLISKILLPKLVHHPGPIMPLFSLGISLLLASVTVVAYTIVCPENYPEDSRDKFAFWCSILPFMIGYFCITDTCARALNVYLDKGETITIEGTVVNIRNYKGVKGPSDCDALYVADIEIPGQDEKFGLELSALNEFGDYPKGSTCVVKMKPGYYGHKYYVEYYRKK